MRKSLLVALFLGLVAFKAEAQMSCFSVSSVIISSKAPPKDWFDTEQEKEVTAALFRHLIQINSEKDVKRREFAREQIALGLARLGREKEARQLAKSATIRQQITYFTSIRAILNGHEATAISSLSRLDGFEKVHIQTLLGSTFYAWRHDKANARKWLLEAIKSARLANANYLIEIQIASNLVEVGAVNDARTIFCSLEQKWKNPNIGQVSVTYYRSSLFSGRLRSGLENEAYAMLANDKALIPMVIPELFTSKKQSKALELLKSEPPLRAFEILRDFNRSAAEDRSRVAFGAMLSYWKQLSDVQRSETVNASNMALAIARFESISKAFNFISSNFKGKIAREAIRSLKAEIGEDADLQKQMNPKTLQSWRDEALKNEEIRARKSASELRGFDGSTEEETSWVLVYYAALKAKNLEKARFALDKSERIALRNGDPYFAENTLSRYFYWLQLGNKKRANWNLLQFKREVAKFKGHPDAAYGFLRNYTPPEIVREFLQTQPPRNLSILSQLFSLDLLNQESKTPIPDWYLKIPDSPTRAVLIAHRASSLWPIETVRIQLD